MYNIQHQKDFSERKKRQSFPFVYRIYMLVGSCLLSKNMSIVSILNCSFHGFAIKCIKVQTVKSERCLNLILKRKRVEIQKNIFKTFSVLLR